MSFDELQKSIASFAAWLNGNENHKPLLKVGEVSFNLKQIQIYTNAMLLLETKDCDKYLCCKQTAIAINGIKAYAEKEKHQPSIKELLECEPFQAILAAVPFLSEEQQKWFPHYLAQAVQEVLDKYDTINSKYLSDKIKGIAADNTLNGNDKTVEIVKEITKFATTSTGISMFDKTKPLKAALKEQLEVQQSAIQRLSPIPPVQPERMTP